jgi:hypothetical protein
MEGKLYTIEEAIKLVEQERILIIAADDSLLQKLPDGKWIGGSNPYMLGEDGGKYSVDQLFIKDFTEVATDMNIKTYDETDIKNITTDGYENGLIIAILPSFSPVHYEFGLRAPSFENQFVNPLLGWVSGDTPEKTLPGVASTYVGNKRYNDRAVVLHIELPENKVGRIEIVSVLNPDPKSDELVFDQDGWKNTMVKVNGEERDLYEYFESVNHVYSLPLMANYSGAKINIGFIKDEENKRALFCAPVYKDTVYKVVTNKTDNYEKEFFDSFVKDKNANIEYSISCIYNYFNFELEGKPLGKTCATFTWGEIAYQLLNITHVYLVIEDRA